MKIPLSILAVVALVLAGFWYLAPAPTGDMVQTRTDLPWQLKALPNGNSQVFDLELGKAKLQDAVNKFGQYEGIAVFQSDEGEKSLEVYFGKVMFGPLTARVIVSLEASATELNTLIEQAKSRDGSPSGDWKFQLPASLQDAQLTRAVKTISYIPGTRGLDADFFKARFGEPVAWMQESEEAVSWFYPNKGLSVLIDSKKSEVLEYIAPKDFVMPQGVTLNTQ